MLLLCLCCAGTCHALEVGASFEKAKAAVHQQWGVRAQATLKRGPIAGAVREKAQAELPWDSSPFMCYATREDTVHFDENAFRRIRTGARTAAELEAALVLLFVHELIHSYQSGVINTCAPRLSGRKLRFICEGHAVWYTEQAGRALGLPERLVTFHVPPKPRSFRNRRGEARAKLLRYLIYNLSRRYVKERCKTFHDFRRLITTQALSYPEMLGRRAPEAVAPMALESRLRPLRSGGWEVAARPLDYLDVMAYFEPEGFEDDRFLLSYVQGVTARAERKTDCTIAFSLVQMRDGEPAAMLYRAAVDGRPPAKAQRSNPCTQWLKKREAPFTAYSGEASGQQITRCLFTSAGLVVEIDVPLNRKAEQAAVELLESLFPH